MQCLQCLEPLVNKQKFCSRSCSAKFNNALRAPMSQQTKDKISASAKANPVGFAANASAFGGDKKSHTRLTLQCLECSLDFEVQARLKHRKYCSESCSNKNKRHENSNRKLRSVYKGYQMDSGAELAFAQLLDQYGINWEKNSSRSFPFVDSKGKDRLYYPDFYLPDHDHWIEIKGKRYIREDDQLRLAAVGNIELMMSNAIRLPKCVGDL